MTLARSQADRVPVEAFIGIVYAVCSALAVIVADRLPHGADEIREILVGNLLADLTHARLDPRVRLE